MKQANILPEELILLFLPKLLITRLCFVTWIQPGVIITNKTFMWQLSINFSSVPNKHHMPQFQSWLFLYLFGSLLKDLIDKTETDNSDIRKHSAAFSS